jgi:hypothetical protein
MSETFICAQQLDAEAIPMRFLVELVLQAQLGWLVGLVRARFPRVPERLHRASDSVERP